MHILLIDDHQMFRCGLSTALQTLGDHSTISEADCIAAAKSSIKTLHREIDLVLLDQGLPDGEGLELLIYLQRHYPLLPVAILSAEENIKLMKQSLDSGAIGFIPKSTDTSIILAAIQLMLSGGTYIPSQMMLSHASATDDNPINTSPLAQPSRTHLTARQQEVMKLIIQGLSNKAIASQLNISEGTVKTHTTAILKSRGFFSRKQLIAAK